MVPSSPPGGSVMSELDEFLDDFLVESREGLDQFEGDLVTLEEVAAGETPADGTVPGQPQLASIFRVLHTIKGSAGFLELRAVRDLAHAGEDLLGQLRDGNQPTTPTTTDALLTLVDQLRADLDEIEQRRGDVAAPAADLMARLRSLAAGDAPSDAPSASDSDPAATAPEATGRATAEDASDAFDLTDQADAVPADQSIIDFGEDGFDLLDDGDESGETTFDKAPPSAPAADQTREAAPVSPLDLDVSLAAPAGSRPAAVDVSAMVSAAELQDEASQTPDQPAPPSPSASRSTKRDDPQVDAKNNDARNNDAKSDDAKNDDANTPAPSQREITVRGGDGTVVDAALAEGTFDTPGRDDAEMTYDTSLMDAPSLSPSRSRGLPGATDSRVNAAVPASSGPAPTIRVDIALLDRLMNLVGELVLTRNQLLQVAGERSDGLGGSPLSRAEPSQGSAIDAADASQRSLAAEQRLWAVSQRLNSITTRLQDGIMHTRMQPIGGLLQRMPRVARDTARQTQRQVKLTLIGEDTELDKSLLEALSDPLMHLVRNAVDHGIESPAQRRAAGKPETGLVTIAASHEGGQVVIEIRDDGRGLDPDHIRRKVVERGLFSQQEAHELTNQSLLESVFTAGFSTAEKITSVSGRGVGMDVVKTDVERIGGTVVLRSRPGEGTTVRLVVPLTLAIIAALVVEQEGQRFALPQTHLVEVLETTGPAARGRVESYHDSLVYRLRDELIPVVRLADVLAGRRTAPHAATAPANTESKTPADTSTRTPADAAADAPASARRRSRGGEKAVLLRAGDTRIALMVQGVHNTQEIVVKPLSAALESLAIYAGATIMGDGSVALILDVLGLARTHRLVGREILPSGSMVQQGLGTRERPQVTVCRVGEDSRIAIPVEAVVRVEVIRHEEIQTDHRGEMLHYRGSILPLVRATALLGLPIYQTDLAIRTVVLRHRDRDGQMRQMGLVVFRALDIEPLPEDAIVQDAGDALPIGNTLVTPAVSTTTRVFSGSAVILDRITPLLDLDRLFDQFASEPLDQANALDRGS